MKKLKNFIKKGEKKRKKKIYKFATTNSGKVPEKLIHKITFTRKKASINLLHYCVSYSKYLKET